MIELLVSISIVLLVLSITITRQDSFNTAVLLRSQSYEVAFDIRDAQISALSSVFDGTEQQSTVGVYFDTLLPNQYIKFIDDNKNGLFDTGEAFGSPGIIDPRFEIVQLRDAGATTYSDMSVTFSRPNFDAVLRYSGGNINQPFVEIEIAEPGVAPGGCDESQHVISITALGQISVDECTNI